MGKRIAACLILLVFVVPTVAVSASEINVVINGVVVDFGEVRPTEYNGYVMVPVRAVFERLDFNVDWVGIGQREIVMLQRHDFTIQITLGELSFTTNGVTHPLGTAARSIGGSIKVPIIAIIESIGLSVVWDENSRVLLISTPAVPAAPVTGQPAFIPTLPPGVPPEFLPTTPPAGFLDSPEADAPADQVEGTPPTPPVLTPVVIHTVQSGENLSRIARLRYPDLNHDDHRVHSQAIDQIVRDNPIITNPNRIRIGWELRIYPFGSIPVPVPTAEDIAMAAAALEFPHLPAEHRIQLNENLDIIARKHFPTLDLDDLDLRLSVIAQIARDNDIENPHHIVAGTYITINPFIRR